MKIDLLTTASILSFCLTSCLNAPRNNKYDPANPDKVYLKGYTHEASGHLLENAIVSLLLDDEIVAVDTSDTEGSFEFDRIDPGVYKIIAEAHHYSSLEIYPESLWAGVYIDDYEVFFTTLDFEEDQEGAALPYGFDTVRGNWRINTDLESPETHSIPNVYKGTNNPNEWALALYSESITNFSLQVKLKILDISHADWKAGFVFRYQNEDNYYSLHITSDTIAMAKVENSGEELLRISNRNFLANTWHSLCVECDNNFMLIHLDGEPFFTVIDNAFADGFIGLFSMNQSGMIASVNFDDITIQLR